MKITKLLSVVLLATMLSSCCCNEKKSDKECSKKCNKENSSASCCASSKSETKCMKTPFEKKYTNADFYTAKLPLASETCSPIFNLLKSLACLCSLSFFSGLHHQGMSLKDH